MKTIHWRVSSKGVGLGNVYENHSVGGAVVHCPDPSLWTEALIFPDAENWEADSLMAVSLSVG